MTNYLKKSNALRDITNVKKVKSNIQIDLTEKEKMIYESQLQKDKRELRMVHNYSEMVFSFLNEIDDAYVYTNMEIPFTDRSKMVDWIIHIHNKLCLSVETLFLTVYIIDKFLIKKAIPANKLSLVGLSALMIACKFEEVVCPTLNNLVVLSENVVTEEEIKKAEKYMLHILNYDILYSNPINFLQKCIKANEYDRKCAMIASYILELSLLYEDLTNFTGSVKAASSVYLARKIIQKNENRNLFYLYSEHNREELRECCNKMIKMITEPIPYKYIIEKFNTPRYSCVSAFVKNYARKNFY